MKDTTTISVEFDVNVIAFIHNLVASRNVKVSDQDATQRIQLMKDFLSSVEQAFNSHNTDADEKSVT